MLKTCVVPVLPIYELPNYWEIPSKVYSRVGRFYESMPPHMFSRSWYLTECFTVRFFFSNLHYFWLLFIFKNLNLASLMIEQAKTISIFSILNRYLWNLYMYLYCSCWLRRNVSALIFDCAGTVLHSQWLCRPNQ